MLGKPSLKTSKDQMFLRWSFSQIKLWNVPNVLRVTWKPLCDPWLIRSGCWPENDVHDWYCGTWESRRLFCVCDHEICTDQLQAPGYPPPPPPPGRPQGIWPLRFTLGWGIWPQGGLRGWGTLTDVSLHCDLRVYPWPSQWTKLRKHTGRSLSRGGDVWPFVYLSPGGVLGYI